MKNDAVETGRALYEWQSSDESRLTELAELADDADSDDGLCGIARRAQ